MSVEKSWKMKLASTSTYTNIVELNVTSVQNGIQCCHAKLITNRCRLTEISINGFC